MAHLWTDSSQRERLSEIKPPLLFYDLDIHWTFLQSVLHQSVKYCGAESHDFDSTGRALEVRFKSDSATSTSTSLSGSEIGFKLQYSIISRFYWYFIVKLSNISQFCN